MKPMVVGSACHRVHEALEEAMAEGTLSLSPELAAHAARCPRCEPEWRQTEALLIRLRDGAARIDLSPVPAVVDHVIARTISSPGSAVAAKGAANSSPRRQSNVGWVVRQVAAIAAMLLITIGGLTYGVLVVNQAMSGVKPSEVAARLVQPLQDWTSAWFR